VGSGIGLKTGGLAASKTKREQSEASPTTLRTFVTRSQAIVRRVCCVLRYPQHNNSTTMSAGLGIPVKLLHESLGHIVTVELKTGHLYRGKLAEGSPSP
jgi:hypothetical protein